MVNWALPRPLAALAQRGVSRSFARADHVHSADYESFDMAWSATVTNPAIGNGSIAAQYIQAGRHVFVMFRISMGSTTTFGSGPFEFSLPVTAVAVTGVGLSTAVSQMGAVARDTSLGDWYPCWVGPNSTTQARMWRPDNFGSPTNLVTVQSTVPFTWAASDEIRAAFFYVAAI